MSVLVVGLSHRSAPVELLERAAVGVDEIPKLLDEMLRGSHVTEAMMLSTCNRIEVFAVVDASTAASPTSPGTRPAGRAPMAELTGTSYVHYEDSAVQHLFAVAAGLDSMVIGEAQMLGQLRAAYARRGHRGHRGPRPARLSQQALRVGKRVHTETGIDAAGASVVSVALDRAADALGRDLAAGGRSSSAPGRWARSPPPTWPCGGCRDRRAATGPPSGRERLGRQHPAHRSRPARPRWTPWRTSWPPRTCWWPAPARSASSSPRETVAAAVVARGRAAAGRLRPGAAPRRRPRRGRAARCLVVDLALSRRAAAPHGARGEAVAAAQELVAEEAQALPGRAGARRRSPRRCRRCAAARPRSSTPSCCGCRRAAARPGPRGPRARSRSTVRRVVDKLLHTPTVQVKGLAADPGGSDYADALRALFGLDPQAPAAVAVQRRRRRARGIEAPMQAIRDDAGGARRSMDRDTPAPEDAPVTAPTAVRDPAPRHPAPARWPAPSPQTVAEAITAPPASGRAGHRQHRGRPLVGAPIADAGGTGVFVSQLREALVDGEVDLAVHSYKDLPTAPDPRLDHRRGARPGGPARRAGRPGRAGARRAARRRRRSAPGSPRRVAQLRALGLGLRDRADPGQRRHPHRQGPAGELDAVVLAAAGLRRLGRLDEVDRAARPAADVARARAGRARRRVPRRRRRARARCSAGSRTRARGPPSSPSERCWRRWRPAAAPRWARWPTWWPT